MTNAKSEARKAPICTHCLSRDVQAKHVIDGSFILVNKDGSPHNCKTEKRVDSPK